MNLGDRIKNNYEDRYRILLPRRTNIIVRIDGKAFHTYTRRLKIFDEKFSEAMKQTASVLHSEIQGTKLVYTQSDEISLWITDYDQLHTDAPFNGNLQKICSVSASIATSAFNNQIENLPRIAVFDSRVFIIPELEEVANYFLWRYRDCEKNSAQTYARSIFSHSLLQGKSIPEIHEMLHAEGRNWVTDVKKDFRNGFFFPEINSQDCLGYEEIFSLVKGMIST